jgi:hypothetical protein
MDVGATLGDSELQEGIYAGHGLQSCPIIM